MSPVLVTGGSGYRGYPARRGAAAGRDARCGRRCAPPAASRSCGRPSAAVVSTTAVWRSSSADLTGRRRLGRGLAGLRGGPSCRLTDPVRPAGRPRESDRPGPGGHPPGAARRPGRRGPAGRADLVVRRGRLHAEAGRRYSEDDWTDPDTPGLAPYPRSKAVAERAAWDFIEREGGDTELVVVNPTFILGPALSTQLVSSCG